MRLIADLRYPAAPDTVFAMLSDPAFQTRKCEAGRAVDHAVSVEDAGAGATRIVVRRTQTTDEFPQFVKGFVGETLTVVETSVWQPAAADGTRDGTIVVEISGAPIKLTARARMVPEPADDGTTGTHESVDGDLKAAVPFLGGKIEQAAEPAIRAAIMVEQRTGTSWLAQL